MRPKYDFRTTHTARLRRALEEAHRAVTEREVSQEPVYGLSASEFDCLVTLGVAQPLRMCDLARQSLLTKSHTTQVVKNLEARGLVRRERSPENDREVLASLTETGQALFETVYPAHMEYLRQLFGSCLDEKEQVDLIRLLRKLADGI